MVLSLGLVCLSELRAGTKQDSHLGTAKEDRPEHGTLPGVDPFVPQKMGTSCVFLQGHVPFL